MKKIILFLFIHFTSLFAWSQWTTPNAANNINNTNTGNVGIGTSSPASKLHVIGHISATDDALSNFVQLWAGNAIIWKSGGFQSAMRFGNATDLNGTNWSEKMRITDAGNVGIGTQTPSAMLEVANGNSASLRVGITSNRANTNSQLLNSLAVIANDNLTTSSNGAVAWDFYDNGVNNGTHPSYSGAILEHVGTGVTGNQYGLPAANQGQLIFQNVSNGVIGTNGVSNVFIAPDNVICASFLWNGNVGIGTTNPGTNKLAVEGTLAARKVVVLTTNPFPDYVFEPGYGLPSLDSVGRYIQAHHHLADIPSADSVAGSGLDLGGNQAALLKKIEELTLYMIEQNKNLRTQSQQMGEQNRMLKEQEKKIERLEKLVSGKIGK